MDRKGLKVKKGEVQDATFITAELGHTPAEEPRGTGAITNRSRDGAWQRRSPDLTSAIGSGEATPYNGIKR